MANSEEIKTLLEKFQETIEQWPRDGSLFLDLMGKKIEQLAQGFSKEVAAQLPESRFNKTLTSPKTASDQTEVYVELYQMDGDNLERWAMILNSLAVQAISRPVYQNETDVCSMIRSKEQKNREAYVSVKVPKSSIVKTPHPLLDSAGRALLQIKPGALKPESILKFVHLSGQYFWEKGKLIKLELPSPIRELRE